MSTKKQTFQVSFDDDCKNGFIEFLSEFEGDNNGKKLISLQSYVCELKNKVEKLENLLSKNDNFTNIEINNIRLNQETINLINEKVKNDGILKVTELVNNGITSNILKSNVTSGKISPLKGVKLEISQKVCEKIQNAWLDYVSDIANNYVSCTNVLKLSEIRKRCNVNLNTLKVFFDDSDTYYIDKYNVTLDGGKIDFSKYRN